MAEETEKEILERQVRSWSALIEDLIKRLADEIEQQGQPYAYSNGKALYINATALAVYAKAVHEHAVALSLAGNGRASDEATQNVIALATLVEEAKKRV